MNYIDTGHTKISSSQYSVIVLQPTYATRDSEVGYDIIHAYGRISDGYMRDEINYADA